MSGRDARGIDRDADAASRLTFLESSVAHLWPDATLTWNSPFARGDHFGTKYLAPGVRNPRVLLPTSRRAALSAVTSQRPRSPQQALRRAGLALLVASGLAPHLMRYRLSTATAEADVDRFLSDIVGRTVTSALAVTPGRANRKPVLQLLDRSGRTVGFAKVGRDALTDRLVHGEGDVLRRLANVRVRYTRPPLVLHQGSWRGHALVVLSPLPTQSGRTPPRTLLQDAMTEFAHCCGVTVEGERAPRYRNELLARAAAIPRPTDADDRDALQELSAALERLPTVEGAPLKLGAWHGDWTPWNCVATRRAAPDPAVLLWDWERCAVNVPLGFDALHYQLQSEVNSGVPHAVAARHCVQGAPAVLEPWRIPAADAMRTAVLYLAELGLRYIADGQRAAGATGGSPETWVIPALTEYLSRPTSEELR